MKYNFKRFSAENIAEFEKLYEEGWDDKDKDIYLNKETFMLELRTEEEVHCEKMINGKAHRVWKDEYFPYTEAMIDEYESVEDACYALEVYLRLKRE